jgi:predicted metalloprotease with PDZ domain
MNKPTFRWVLPALWGLSSVLGLWAGDAAAQPLPPVSAAAYPGTLVLRVDATDLDRKIVRVRETLPVRPGPLVLYYPNWIPGHHANVGPLARLAGLTLHAGERPLAWQRNSVEMGAFHVEVPVGVSTLEAEFQYLVPVEGGSGATDISREMLGLAWDQVLLYPAGFDVSRIQVQPRLTLPAGWRHASALELAARDGPTLVFQAVSAETLVDSPVYAGAFFKQIDLDPGAEAAGRAPVRLNLFATQPGQLVATPEQIAAHAALVTQADKLFGARHFRHYDVLLTLSEGFGEPGLEHHQSSENGVKGDYFTDWSKGAPGRDLIPHEYTHSWNGKFRRPADLLTPHFNTPMRNSLLWVYEGQTQFWGKVLAARAGLLSTPEAMDDLAQTAAYLIEGRIGRGWRNLQDTTNEPLVSPGRDGRDWRSWQRSGDYYDEMVFVWAEADALIRDQSQGQRSMDDFARAFFGTQAGRAPGDFRPVAYNFDDVVRELNRVQANDWAGFLRQRLDGHDATSLVAGLRRAGWELVFGEQQSDYSKNADARDKQADFWYSLGFNVSDEGKLVGCRWDGPAFRAGLTKGATLVAVNGRAYRAEGLKDAVTEAKAGTNPLQLLVKRGERYDTLTMEYRGGLRHPRLERIADTTDHLGPLLAPR